MKSHVKHSSKRSYGLGVVKSTVSPSMSKSGLKVIQVCISDTV